jgi:hypothetical protein
MNLLARFQHNSANAGNKGNGRNDAKKRDPHGVASSFALSRAWEVWPWKRPTSQIVPEFPEKDRNFW